MCTGTWGDKNVVVKMFQGKKARYYWNREKRGIDTLVHRAIPTPKLLLAGELQDSTPVLITEFICASETALEVWNQRCSDAERSALLHDLVGTVAELHNKGLWQQDLHLGNFLVSAGNIYALDGDAVRARPEPDLLPAHISRKNLALFLAQIPPAYEYFFEEILRHYCILTGQKLKTWETLLDNELPAQRKKRRLSYVAKAFRTCSEFACRHTWKHRIIQRKDAPQELMRQLRTNPDALITQGTMLKSGNSATVVHLHNAEGDWLIKRYNIKSFWHGLGRCLRPTRAAVSWGNAHRLKISGINTPRAIAVMEKRFGPLRFTGYYVSEYIAAPSVTRYFIADSATPEQQAQVVTAMAQLFRLLLRLGIYHGDCKASNFLIKDETPWVIDLDSMREFRSRRRFLHHYAKDRARFLRNWKPESEIRSRFAVTLPRT